jgi:hypothetical protein
MFAMKEAFLLLYNPLAFNSRRAAWQHRGSLQLSRKGRTLVQKIRTLLNAMMLESVLAGLMIGSLVSAGNS